MLRMVPPNEFLADTKIAIALLEARAEELRKLISTEERLTKEKKLGQEAKLKSLKDELEGVRGRIADEETLKLEISAILGKDYKTDPALSNVAVHRVKAAKCKTLRNQLQDEILARSEMICAAHLSDMKASAASLNLNFSVGTLISSAFGAISKVASVKSGLAATAAISSGSQTAVNKEIYQQYFAPAIGNSITSRRASLLADVRAQQSKDIAAYPVARAVAEAVRFHEACSLSNGLSYLMESVSKRTDADVAQLGERIDSMQKSVADADAQLAKIDEVKDPQTAQSARIARNALLQELDVLRLRRLNLQRLQ